MDFRLGRGSYLIAWAVLSAVQVWALQTYLPVNATAIGLAIVAVVQVLKVPVTAGRLNDLGRIPSEAILGLVPLVNFGLWYQLIGSTPTDDKRSKRLAAWAGEPTPWQSWVKGLVVVGKAAPTVLLLSVAFAGAHTWLGYRLAAFADVVQKDLIAGRDPAFIDTLTQAFFALGLLLAVYTAVNFSKGNKASRRSWVPSLFMVPSLLAGGAFSFMRGGGPIPTAFLFTAFDLAWICTMDAALVVAWVTAADLVDRGESPTPAKLIGAMQRRVLDVAGPFGGAWTAIMIGMQVVIPGIHYALQYAFVGPVAVLEADEVAVRQRSSDLSKNIRRRIFVLVFIGFAITLGLQMGVAATMQGPEVLAQMLVMPTAVEEMPAFIGDLIGNMVWAVTVAGLVFMYKGRVTKLDKTQAGSASESSDEAEADAPPTS